MDEMIKKPGNMNAEYICQHYGEDHRRQLGAVVTPIYQTSSYNLESEYEYTRGNAPNFEVVEKKIAALEGAEGGVLTGAGVSAIYLALFSYLHAGDHVVMVGSAYINARRIIKALTRFGITYTLVRGKKVEDFEAAIRPNTKVIHLESPSSVVCELQDIRAVCELAHSKGIKVTIDNTAATPLFQRPLEMGADIVIYSASKYFGGHTDLIGGIACANGEVLDTMRNARIWFGLVSAPLNAWLIERGLRTLPLRMQQIQKNSLAVARLLDKHPAVEKVFHPGVDSCDQKELFRKQMSGVGGVFSFRAKDATIEQYRDFVSRCHMFQNAVSWGGHESLAYMLNAENDPANPVLGEIFSKPTMRLYTGLENTDDLLEDIENALKAFK